MWNLRRNLSDKMKDVMTIGSYNGHVLIKDIKKLPRLDACMHSRERFTQACGLQRRAKTCAEGRTIIIVQTIGSKAHRQHVRASLLVYHRVTPSI